jgi:hypothetical protein
MCVERMRKLKAKGYGQAIYRSPFFLATVVKDILVTLTVKLPQNDFHWSVVQLDLSGFCIFDSTGFGWCDKKTASLPSFPLVRSEVERYFVEHPFSFRIHFAISEAYTLIVDPLAQFRLYLAADWNIA